MPEPSPTLRAFVALPLPEPVTRALHRVQHSLQAALGADLVRWTAPEQIHVTLKFLGNVPGAAVTEISDALRCAAAACVPLELRAEGLGGFPNERRPRVIWVGLEGDVSALLELQARVEAAIGRWAERAEARAFQPHLTLGRVRENAARQAVRVGEALAVAPAFRTDAWRAGEIHLLRSELSPRGAVHTRLAALPMRMPPSGV